MHPCKFGRPSCVMVSKTKCPHVPRRELRELSVQEQAEGKGEEPCFAAKLCTTFFLLKFQYPFSHAIAGKSQKITKLWIQKLIDSFEFFFEKWGKQCSSRTWNKNKHEFAITKTLKYMSIYDRWYLCHAWWVEIYLNYVNKKIRTFLRPFFFEKNCFLCKKWTSERVGNGIKLISSQKKLLRN